MHTLSLHQSRSCLRSDCLTLIHFNNFQFFCLPISNLFVYMPFLFFRKNQQFPNLNHKMVTLAYQRVVPATLLTRWTLATIISRKHQALVMAVQEISPTIMRKKNVGEQLSGFSGSKGKKMITQFHSNIPTRLPS